MTPDLINACFELGGALLIWANVRRLYQHKAVRGVFAPVFVFYTLWGFWNCIFYPAIGQWLSFYAGAGTTLGNLTWCALAWRYRVRCDCRPPGCYSEDTCDLCAWRYKDDAPDTERTA